MTIAESAAAQSRLMQTVAGGANLVIALALITLSVLNASPLLPVALTFRLGGPGIFASVDLAAAAAIVMAVAAAARLVVGLTAGRPGAPSIIGVRMIELSQTAAITVFLVAQLNGVIEAGTLILVYAMAAGAVGILWMHSRAPRESRPSPWPYSLGAALAVVPWGIVALYQVTALVTAVPAAPIVRVLTIVLLLLAALPWLIERLVHRERVDRMRAETAHIAVQVANGVALVVLTVGLARPSALF